MGDFHHRKGHLFCEATPVERIVDAVGTPCYIYSRRALETDFHAYEAAFSAANPLIAFATKANSNLAILRLFARMGGGADIVSEGELRRALAAGVDPQKIVFAGVGKTREEMRAALRVGVLMFNVESAQELLALDETAREVGVVAPVALRVNPDINPKTHPYISTGFKTSKFGIDIARAVAQYKQAGNLRYVRVVGIH